MNMRLSITVAMIALSVSASAADKMKDRMVLVQSEDREMLRAIQQAHATLDDFLQLSSNPPPGAKNFRLKVKFADAHGIEHMWVTSFQKTATGFTGILKDQPELVTKVRYGQQVTFQRKDISDWGYEHNGRQKGSFTVCAMFKHMPPAEVQKYRDDYGFECP